MLIRRSGAGRNGGSTAARESWALMSDSDNISSCDPKIAGSQNMQKNPRESGQPWKTAVQLNRAMGRFLQCVLFRLLFTLVELHGALCI